MAQETILTLKEYKAQIDELKSSIGDLENATDRYGGLLNSTVGTLDDNIKLLTQQKNALNDLKQQYKEGQISLTSYNKSEKELKTAISELNQQINIQQKQANATKGSYNDLNQTLALLKNSYKQLTEEERKSSFGKTMIKDINDLSEKLKKIDESMGDYHRNIGNYASAFDGIKATFGALGLSMQGLDPVFKIATVAGYGFGKMLDTLKAHPFVTIASILVMTFMKLKQAINGNEESSKKWAVAMSAFQPILNAITNAVDWLASKLVNVVSWVTGSLPKLLKNFGNFAKGVANVAGTILDVMLYVPRQVVQAYTRMNEQLISGVKWLIDGVAEVMDILGFDIADSVKQWTTSVSNVAKSAMDGLNDSLANVGNYVKKVGVDIDKTMTKWARATENQIELTKAQQKLDEDRRKQNEDSEASLLNQQRLRNEIAESSGKKRVELLKELKKEIEDNGRKELEIAQRTLALEERKRALTPNSREANLYYEQLRRNVISVQAATEAATVRINRQITSTESGLDALATKSAKDAENAAQKASRDIVQTAKTALEQSKAVHEESIAELTEEYETRKKLGSLSLSEELEFEQKKHELTKGYLQDQNKIIVEALEKEGLLEEDRVQLAIQNMKIATKQVEENTRHRLDQEKILTKGLEQEVEARNKKLSSEAKYSQIELENNFKMAEQVLATYFLYGKKGLDQLFDSLINSEAFEESPEKFEELFNYFDYLVESNINTFSEYQEELNNLQNNGNYQRLNFQIDYFNKMLVIYDEYLESMKEKYGEESIEYNAVLEKRNELAIESLKLAMESNRITIDEEIDKRKKQDKLIDDQIKSYRRLADGMADIFGVIADIYEEGIRKQVEVGKISEEEAKKRFETVKAFQISEAVLSTLSGAVGAFMGTWKDESIPFTWLRAVLAGVNTAAVVGTGLAQIEKISHTQYGSSDKSSLSGSSSSSSVSSSVQAMPLLYEPADIKTLQNIQTQSAIETQTQDTRVYIVESDIQESGKRVEVRDKNTTW